MDIWGSFPTDLTMRWPSSYHHWGPEHASYQLQGCDSTPAHVHCQPLLSWTRSRPHTGARCHQVWIPGLWDLDLVVTIPSPCAERMWGSEGWGRVKHRSRLELLQSGGTSQGRKEVVRGWGGGSWWGCHSPQFTLCVSLHAKGERRGKLHLCWIAMDLSRAQESYGIVAKHFEGPWILISASWLTGCVTLGESGTLFGFSFLVYTVGKLANWGWKW